MNPLLIIVPIVWLCGWITAAKHDAKEKRNELIQTYVKTDKPDEVRGG